MNARITPLDDAALRRALVLRDLTDASKGPHAIQLVLSAVTAALAHEWASRLVTLRAPPIVAVADNYDRLHYAKQGVARDARYTRYVTEDLLLRTQTSAMIPGALRILAGARVEDVLLACPGLVYRRDAIDRTHLGEIHQVDLWRLSSKRLDRCDLLHMVDVVVRAALPGRAHRVIDAEHPYTKQGLQIDVEHGAGWVEIGECGLASPDVLAEAGIDVASVSGLAMGLGLDRLVMLRKCLPDIRLLRSDDPRVAAQMLDLEPYRQVSTAQPIRRDLSIAVDEDDGAEDLGDRVRAALGERAEWVEAVEILSETPYGALSAAARARIGMLPEHKNVLVRVVLRPLGRTLTNDEANDARDDIVAALHRGTVAMWAGARRGAITSAH